MSSVRILQTDFSDSHHREGFLQLLDHYASDPMGGGQGLSAYAREHLIERLRVRPRFVSFLAFDVQQPVGLINCFEGFSTFSARPLLNVHDIVVHREWRGRGIGRMLLTAVQTIATERGCCKLTLEVLDGNETALAVYASFGFKNFALDPRAGKAVFLEKKI
ncbi:MAG TPA: GNAT family N-acetyltransferase [Rhodocyclaceae bacterium]|nr:GNAT family N-acetyltransferase [Rhodocyclaceae bacterium]